MKTPLHRCRTKLSRLLFGSLHDSLAAQNQRLHLEMLDRMRELETKLFRLAGQIQSSKPAAEVKTIQETEFRVCSQFGEDGIIQFLIANLDLPNKTFVEFGVEDYTEANTRFLLVNNNWSGLVLDGSPANIEKIIRQPIYWKHDLTARPAFITRDNINDLIAARFSGDIGLLSIDVDGNDYWIWEAIEVISPRIVICEYNSLFGQHHAISIPYQPDFVRQNAHHSHLYFGASLAALCQLAERRGYGFVGSNSAGNNAFFVRKDVIGRLPVTTAAAGYRVAKFRESRDELNNLSFVAAENRLQVIADMDVHDFTTGRTVKLGRLQF